MADTELEVRERPPAATEPSQPPQRVDRVTTIRPAPRWPHLDVRELWHFRELLGTLIWRDVAVRYKQTSIGVAWAILQPFLTMVVLSCAKVTFSNRHSLANVGRRVPACCSRAAIALSINSSVRT